VLWLLCIPILYLLLRGWQLDLHVRGQDGELLRTQRGSRGGRHEQGQPVLQMAALHAVPPPDKPSCSGMRRGNLISSAMSISYTLTDNAKLPQQLQISLMFIKMHSMCRKSWE
jgi:hypothetical protein